MTKYLFILLAFAFVAFGSEFEAELRRLELQEEQKDEEAFLRAENISKQESEDFISDSVSIGNAAPIREELPAPFTQKPVKTRRIRSR